MNITQRNQMVEQNMNLAYHVANKFNCKRISQDDIKQVAMIGLIKAVEKFNPNKGKFSTYACKVIKNEIINEIKRANRFPAEMADDEMNQLESDTLSPADKEYFMFELESKLDHQEFVAVTMQFLEGCTQKEVAEEIGCSQGQVCRIIKKAKKKIKLFYR